VKVVILGINGFIGNALAERILTSTEWTYRTISWASATGKNASISWKVISASTGNGSNTEYHVKKCDVEVPSGTFYGRGCQDIGRRVPSTRKAREIIGWTPPTDLETALKKRWTITPTQIREPLVTGYPHLVTLRDGSTFCQRSCRM
jgi:nucleoside-diphosphate-sugar epimerase